MDFAAELSRLGPAGAPPAPGVEDARRYTIAWASGSKENFPVLSWALPRELRPAFADVYAWCRWADHLADEVRSASLALEYLDLWEAELHRCFEDRPRHPITVALAETARKFDLSMEPFLNLLQAFRRDQTQTRYETFDELLDYCRCSANPVGRLVLALCRCRRPDAERLSDQVCTGLQLANFWQDVAVDWGRGRVYLPQEDLRRFGVGEQALSARKGSAGLRRLILFEAGRAETRLRDGSAVAACVPMRMGIVLGAFAEGGLAVLRKIRAADGEVVASRPRLTRGNLASSLIRATLARWRWSFGSLPGGAKGVMR